jgi:hypothetical protein
VRSCGSARFAVLGRHKPQEGFNPTFSVSLYLWVVDVALARPIRSHGHLGGPPYSPGCSGGASLGHPNSLNSWWLPTVAGTLSSGRPADRCAAPSETGSGCQAGDGPGWWLHYAAARNVVTSAAVTAYRHSTPPTTPHRRAPIVVRFEPGEICFYKAQAAHTFAGPWTTEISEISEIVVEGRRSSIR